jgi:hypothetical protein
MDQLRFRLYGGFRRGVRGLRCVFVIPDAVAVVFVSPRQHRLQCIACVIFNGIAPIHAINELNGRMFHAILGDLGKDAIALLCKTAKENRFDDIVSYKGSQLYVWAGVV